VSDNETPAETIRRAAALMRERAQGQPETPWLAVAPEDAGSLAKIVTADVPEWIVARTLADAADHIASWHPLVALAVAEWLETEAHMVDLRGNSPEGQTFGALKVARAYLGEVPA
jgi:hypothetical protein